MLPVIVLTVVFLYLFCKYFSQRPKNFPPGPPNYPLIGGTLSLPTADIHFAQQEWLGTYGPLVGVMLGPIPALFIAGNPHVLDALKKPEFQERPKIADFKERSFNKFLGVFFSDGPQWQVSRKFTVKFTKGFGTQNMEELMLREMDELVARIRGGKVYQVSEIFRESTVNIIWTVLSGNRCTMEDNRIRVLLDNLTAAFRSGRPGGRTANLIALIPFLTRFDEQRNVQRRANKMLQEFFREHIQEHRDTLDKQNIRDFYDAYLVEEMKAIESGVNADLWTEENLIIISVDIFAASYESLNSSMSFMLLYLLLHPEAQTKLHQELDTQLGSRRPTLEDRSKLNYVQALIHEVFRINPIAPIVAPHRCSQDTTFDGYFVPKDTLLFMSLWSLLHDEKHFPEPEKFKPERFLNEEGKFDKSSPNMINFGMGRRACAGDFVAQNVMFIYTTSFFQRYSVHRDPNHPDLPTKAMPGFTTSPQPFKAIIRERY